VSVTYGSIGWNRQKKLYDLAIVAGLAGYLALFILVGLYWHPFVTIETLLIRALGTCAFLLLHIVLVIGPLCRLYPRFLPLLYNRRHLGVTTFLVALAHGSLSIFQFHAAGDLNPLVSVLAGNTRYSSLSDFPFQTLGLAALVILFLMAATSHDFWLANLGASAWKRLHMMVYVAYGLLVAHVTLGALQAETSPLLTGIMGLGIATVVTLHLLSAWRERRNDRPAAGDGGDQFVDVCSVSEIAENRARIVTLAGERVAVFRYEGRVSAISNVCQHQNGPLGEGRIIDGCITCPWHGFQYLPATGASPPPFIEKVPTFRVRIVGDRVQVDPRPNSPGTYAEPAAITS
jgi:nitrite reductase/ring-hydroxylating ferredoxin subunit/DMSO/TMAO reductase YedYZ heme-binding membrane subunit